MKVTTKLNIGAREVYYPQVKSKGAITIIPEYNGTLLTTVEVDPTCDREDHRRRSTPRWPAKLPSTLDRCSTRPRRRTATR